MIPKNKVHLGCGEKFLPGYTHVDLADFDHIDFKHDIKSLPMFENESIDVIYSSHTFEYFDREEAIKALNAWRRVLKSGGILRLAVPNFEALIDVYLQTNEIERVIGPLYGRWKIPGSNKIVYHKTVYDFKSLSNLLESNGFNNVRLWDWKEVFQGELEGFDDYSQAYFPHMRKEDGLLISLNIEADRI